LAVVDTNIINFETDQKQETPSIVDIFKRVHQTILDHAREEEERTKSPDWEYRRIHLTSKKMAEVMLSPDTPLEIKYQLECATFIGYEWVYVGDQNDRLLAG